MKNRLMKFVTVSICMWLLIMVEFQSNAAQSVYTYGDYEYTNVDKYITIVGYTNDSIVDLTIPTAFQEFDFFGIEIYNYSLDAIGWGAFENKMYLENLVVSEGISKIGGDAFAGCINLQEVQLPNSLKRLNGFNNCTSLEHIIIPDSVEYLGNQTFLNCSSLKTVEFGSGITSVNSGTFANCTELDKVFLPDNIITIEYEAFKNCTSLYKLRLSENLTTIGEGAFQYNTSLTSIVIPESVETIDPRAFKNCSNLKEVYFMGNKPNISADAFDEASDDIKFYYMPGMNGYDSTKFEISPFNFTFNKGNLSVYTMRVELDSYNGNDRVVVVPFYIGSYEVSEINAKAFYNNDNIESVILPQSLDHIEAEAFYNCENLTTIHFQGDAPSAGTIGYTPESYIGGHIIRYCADDLFILYNPRYNGYEASTLASDMFYSDLLNYELIPSHFTCEIINDNAIITGYNGSKGSSDKLGGDYNLPNEIAGFTVTEIGDRAFKDTENMETLTLPSNVEVIGHEAFKNCLNLNSVSINYGTLCLNTISDGAFEGCTNLENLPNPITLIHIGSRAFYGCNSYSLGIIPSSVEYIGDRAFAANQRLRKVYFLGNAPYMGENAFDTNAVREDIDFTVLYKAGKTGYGTPEWRPNNIDIYKCIESDYIYDISDDNEVTIRSYYGDDTIVTIPSTLEGHPVKMIGGNAFSGRFMSKVIMPDSIETIGNSAFSSARNLEEITLSNNLTDIGFMAFANCISLKSIEIPDSVTNIGVSAFINDLELENVALGMGLTYLDRRTFSGCSNLSEITIPENITEIREEAFKNCSSLDSITLPASINVIKANAFSDCTNLSLAFFNGDAPMMTAYAGRNTMDETVFNNTAPNFQIIHLSDVIGYEDLPYRCSMMEGNFSYYLTDLFNDKVSIISGFYGDDEDIEVPSSLGNKTTYAITTNTFYGLNNLVSIKIPRSVQFISEHAFVSASELKRVYIFGDNTSIDDNAFNDCGAISIVDLSKDRTPPKIVLIGENPTVLDLGSNYVELGAKAVDEIEGVLTDQIKIRSAIDINVVGKYLVNYTCVDYAGNYTHVNRVVIVQDNIAPELTLKGDNPLILDYGNNYTEEGYFARDNYDGNLTAEVKISGDVDETVLGEYQLTYKVEDSSGNKTITNRTVKVVDRLEPIIKIIGSHLIVVNYGDAYVEEGATAKDNHDGDISAHIIISGIVDVTTLGDYTVKYSVGDSSHNQTVTERIVRVVDIVPPVVNLIGEDYIVIEHNGTYIEKGVNVVDNYDKDMSNRIFIDNPVNTSELGTYYVSYFAVDSSGNKSSTLTRCVEVVSYPDKILHDVIKSLDLDDIISTKNNDKELDVFVRKINTIRKDYDNNKLRPALEKLEALYKTIDGQDNPKDTMTGEGVAYIASLLLDFIDELKLKLTFEQNK